MKKINTSPFGVKTKTRLESRSPVTVSTNSLDVMFPTNSSCQSRIDLSQLTCTMIAKFRKKNPKHSLMNRARQIIVSRLYSPFWQYQRRSSSCLNLENLEPDIQRQHHFQLGVHEVPWHQTRAQPPTFRYGELQCPTLQVCPSPPFGSAHEHGHRINITVSYENRN
jgi:hypothetical protein